MFLSQEITQKIPKRASSHDSMALEELFDDGRILASLEKSVNQSLRKISVLGEEISAVGHHTLEQSNIDIVQTSNAQRVPRRQILVADHLQELVQIGEERDQLIFPEF
eukprot:21370_1